MYQLFFTFLFINSVMFSQIYLDKENLNLVPYIGEEQIGMRLNPVITGMKGTKANQEIDLNMVLYNHNKYTLKDNQVLGFLEGRFVSEIPLSDFDLYKRLREDKTLELSNFAEEFQEYQEAVRLYEEFINKVTPEQQKLLETEYEYEYVYEYVDEDEYEYEYVDEEYEETTETNSISVEESAEDVQQQTENVVEEVLEQRGFNYYSGLFHDLTFKAQNLLPQNAAIDNVSNMTTGAKLLSEEDLKFLICFQKLKSDYNRAIAEYNQAVEEQENSFKDTFDPADPTERFTVVFWGEDNNVSWIKNFSLDGKQSYQSYNSQVWYLGFKIPITKKDIRVLHDLFRTNKKVKYFIKGTTDTAEFTLSSYLKTGLESLLDLFARGKMFVDERGSFPMMRNFDEKQGF